MVKVPTLAIDLPDDAGNVCVTWNYGRYFFGTIFARHGPVADSAQIAAYDTLIAQMVAHAVEQRAAPPLEPIPSR